MQSSTDISRRRFLAGSAGVAAASCSNGPAVKTGERRPNVLFVMPDQMRAQAMGCAGNQDVMTPNLDRLASQGVLFRNTLANTPVCCPARAILQTGLYTHRHGVVANDLRLRESHVTIAEVLREEGYRTGFIGKWHLDGGKRMPGYVPPGPRRQGYEFWAANQCSHRHFDTQYFRDSAEPIPMEKFETEGWADLGLEFLEDSRKDGRPFFVTIQPGPPHNPYKAPENYEAMYDAEKITLRPNWKGGAPKAPGRNEIASYYAMVTSIDDEIGRLTAALEEMGMAEDTVVLFASDHGDMLGSQGFRLKRKPWEESIRVPGIFRYPRKITAGRQENALLAHIDFAPTLLALCGAPIPAQMQGTDRSRLVLGETSEGPDSAFFQILGPYHSGGVAEGWRGVRTQRYMYARYESKPWVLYDLEQDPYEMNNLTGDPAAASLSREHDRQTRLDWRRRAWDTVSNGWVPAEFGTAPECRPCNDGRPGLRRPWLSRQPPHQDPQSGCSGARQRRVHALLRMPPVRADQGQPAYRPLQPPLRGARRHGRPGDDAGGRDNAGRSARRRRIPHGHLRQVAFRATLPVRAARPGLR
jgi:arylsulfatase A-like enzyme